MATHIEYATTLPILFEFEFKYNPHSTNCIPIHYNGSDYLHCMDIDYTLDEK